MGVGSSSKKLETSRIGCVERFLVGLQKEKDDNNKKENDEFWSGPPGNHSPLPVDNIPYQGYDYIYCFLDFNANFTILRNDENLGPNAITTDMGVQMDDIEECYKEGFTLNKLVRVPTFKMTTNIEWTSPQHFQAILSKPKNKYGHPLMNYENWQIKLEKIFLSTKTLPFNRTSKDNKLASKIEIYTKLGGRLAGVEAIGFQRSSSSNAQYGILGIEMFFNVPLVPSSCNRWTYHVLSKPVTYKIIPDLSHNTQQVLCEVDYAGQLSAFLDTGWKLVDICFDGTSIADAYRNKSTFHKVETIWIFEKETDKLQDDRPIYEGIILEYLHKVKMTSTEEKPCRDWRPFIAGMGSTGWELTTIIQTPVFSQTGVLTYTMKLLFIFQRLLSHFPLQN